MKKFFVLLTLIALTGCADKIQSYIEHPRQLIEDPHFAAYERERSQLESSYLKEEIGYPEYLEQKEQLDRDYARDVLDREKIIHEE